MKTNLKALAALALVLILPYGIAQTSSKKKQTASEAAVQAQIDALRNDMQSQIQSLKQQLAAKGTRSSSRRSKRRRRQAAAEQAQQAAQQAQQANTTNTEAVTSCRARSAIRRPTMRRWCRPCRTPRRQRGSRDPDVLHFKGITLSPTGSFLAAETVWRQRATGGGINTSFTALPLAYAPQYYYSEFYGSGRQSRVAMLAEGRSEEHDDARLRRSRLPLLRHHLEQQ